MGWENLLKPAHFFDMSPPFLEARRAGKTVPLVCSFGGGLNSSAGLVLLRRLNDIPDLILFADTGGEKKETYAHTRLMADWCVANGFPTVITVKRMLDPARQKHEEKYSTLEEECLVKKCLPSIAYYHRSCSDKWKQEPQNKHVRNWAPAQECWKTGSKVLKAIFYDANEDYRAVRHEDARHVYWHPLIEYGWGRAECIEALTLEGLPVPPKSSCFYCPEMSHEEIIDLGRTDPDLLARALAMEANANLTSIKGLGKHEYAWRDLVAGRVELSLIKEKKRLPCMCHDDAEE